MSAHKVNADFYVVNGWDSNDLGRGSAPCGYRYRGRAPGGRPSARAYLLWFCAWHPCYVLVYSRSFEGALDDAIDASDSIPAIAALLRSGEEQAKEAYQEAYQEALEAGEDEDDAQEAAWEASDVGMTRAGNCSEPFSSEEWGGSEATREQILDMVTETNRRNSYLDPLRFPSFLTTLLPCSKRPAR